ncbi:MAG: HNH endonuclease [Coleofasciculaceae cyanobacterium]
MSNHRYPDNWKEIATAIKETANWKCSKCHRQCLKPGTKTELSCSERIAYTLTVHHWNRNPGDNRTENLVALCTGCHLFYHQGGKSNTSPGQLELF